MGGAAQQEGGSWTGTLVMAKVRGVVASGDWYTIRCAVMADGKSPAREFLDELNAGHWLDGIQKLKDRPEDQIADSAQFLARMEVFADTGELEGRHQINCLSQGIWEFKVGRKRLSFYDTSGAGEYEPKRCIVDRDMADYPRGS
jgi:hypothetical protein